MKSPLERLCRALDDILVAYGMAMNNRAGLLAANDFGMTWPQGRGDGGHERSRRRELVMPQEWANIGMVLVNDWRQPQSQPTPHLPGDVEKVTRRRGERVETVDVLALIAVHQAELAAAQPPSHPDSHPQVILPQTKKVVPVTRPLSMSKVGRSAGE